MPKLLLRTRWPFIIFAVAVLLAAQIMVTLNYFYQSGVQHLELTVSTAEDNLAQQHDFQQLLQNTFLAQRAFAITGAVEYREKYERLRPDLSKLLDQIIRHSSQNDPAAQAIRTELDRMIAFMNEGIQRRLDQGDALVPSPQRTREAFVHMSRLDEMIGRYIAHERAYLTDIKNQQQAKQEAYNQTILLVALLSTLFLGALGYLLLKQQQKENRTQADLKSIKERLDLAITGANDGVWDWDILHDKVFFSARLKEIAGYSDMEMPNDIKAYDLLICDEDRAAIDHAYDAYLNRRTPMFEVTFRIRHKDGTTRWIMSRGQALWNEADVAYRMVGVHTDITSMKNLEASLNTAREMAEQANAAKTDFLSNISHEIRTPLNAIIGISRILAKTKPLTEAFREHVNVMHTGAKNLYSLISDLLDLSKLEQGSLTLENREFRLLELVQENVELYRYYARDKSIQLTFESNLAAEETYLGDSLRIGQIVNNLLSNAIKFTEAGTVHVSLNRLPHTAHDKANLQPVQLLVEDTGIGIPAGQLDNIFNKFTQSDRSISRRYGGTGLGLSICKELCSVMGASISVHSLEGQGSEFRVDLQLEPVHLANDAAPAAGENRILLVEDYQANIYIMEALLSSLGFACDSVTTGDEALRTLLSDRRNPYAAVLLDLELPDMTGYEVAEKTRQYETQHALPSLPIIATTAHAGQYHRDRCFASGMNDYLMKPVDLTALEKTLSLYVPSKIGTAATNKTSLKQAV